MSVNVAFTSVHFQFTIYNCFCRLRNHASLYSGTGSALKTEPIIVMNHSLLSVLEPVYDEYSQLETKYEIEKGCRSKAEEYATKVRVLLCNIYQEVAFVVLS